MPYEVFEHTADLGLRVRADSLDDLFAAAAQGLFSVVVANLDQVRPVERREYRLEPGELDFLLFDWLNELLFTFESEGLLLSRFDVKIDPAGAGGLQAVAHGEPIDRPRHHMDHELKAITYHGLKVEPSNGGWLAEVIVDI